MIIIITVLCMLSLIIPIVYYIGIGTLLKVYREFAYYLATLQSWSFSRQWTKGQRTKLKQQDKSDFKVSLQLAKSSANTISTIGVKERKWWIGAEIAVLISPKHGEIPPHLLQNLILLFYPLHNACNNVVSFVRLAGGEIVFY